MRFSLRVIIVLLPVLCLAVIVQAVEEAKLKEVLQGCTWKCVGAESGGKPDPADEGAIVKFTDKKVTWQFRDGRKWEFDYRLDETVDPPAIDWCYNFDDTPLEMRGILKSDGRSLQICGQLGFKGESIMRPKEFATKKDDDFLRMAIFTALEDDPLKAPK